MFPRENHKRYSSKTMLTFGQFILPLMVLVALALLFFSVRLFFYQDIQAQNDAAVMEDDSKQITKIIQKKESKTQKSGSENQSITAKTNSGNEDNTVNTDVKGTEAHVPSVLARPVSEQ